MNPSRFPAYLALGVGIMSLSFSAIFVRWANAPGIVTSFYRMAIAAVLLAWPFYRQVKAQGSLSRRGLRFAVLGGLFFAADLALWATGVIMSGAANPTLLANTAPLWVGLGALIIFRERLKAMFWVGLLLAMAGVAWVMADQGAGQGDLAGDLMALGAAMSWAGIALVVRVTPLERVAPEVQLFSQLAISAVLLMIAAQFFGPFIRDLQPIHWAGYAFQTLAIASFGYLFWFFLMKRYPASGVASFSFLSPVFGVGLGWFFLNETVGGEIIGGLMLVAVGITLINRR